MNLDQEIIKIAKEARESIGKYCIDVCKAKCCQRGYLLLMTDGEVKAIVGNKKVQYIKEEVLKPYNNGFYMYDSAKKPCKNLKKDFYCKIHLKTQRPMVCRDYPIFFIKDRIMLGQNCQAVQDGLLDLHVEKLKELGAKFM